MTTLLWKVNLPAGRITSVSEHGAYLVEADESRRYWTIEFTDFPSDGAVGSIPPCPTRRFTTWETACAAGAQHAAACGAQPVGARA